MPGGFAGTGSFILPFITLPTGFNYTLVQSANTLTLNVTAAPAGAVYWTGSQATNSWNTVTTVGASTFPNFSTDVAGATNFGFAPE